MPITEKLKIELDSAEAEARARSFGSAYNGVMESAVRKTDGFGRIMKQMPEQFAKSSTALLLLQNSMGQFGGKAADALNKLTGIAAVAATGGPFGIAIAAATAGIALFAEAMERSTMVTRGQALEIEQYTKKLQDLEKQARGAEEAVNPEMAASRQRERISLLQKELDGLKEGLSMLLTHGRVRATENTILVGTVEHQRRMVELKERELNAEQRLIQASLARSTVADPRSTMGPATAHVQAWEAEQQRLADIGAMRAMQELELEQRIATGKREIRESNAILMGEIEQKNFESSLAKQADYFNRYSNVASGAFGLVLDSSLTALEAMVAGEEKAVSQFAVGLLKGIGRQMIGLGTRDLMAGIGASLLGLPNGPLLIAHGSAELGIGTVMAATGAVAAGAARASSSGASSSAGTHGAGGSTGFSSPSGGGAGGNAPPIIVMVDGVMTVEERAVVIQRGIDTAISRGLM